MGVVSLITDFGSRDEYVGVMKGAVLKANSNVVLVDVCHEIAPFDRMAAVRMLKAAYPFFPDRTVHVVVVDPGVGSSRHIVALSMDGHVFLMPDNGIPAALIRGRAVDQLVRVDTQMLGLEPLSSTFHGRDLFAPVAALLANGGPLDDLGSAWDADRLVDPPLAPTCRISEGQLCGHIASVDRFGNLITDIDEKTLAGFRGTCEPLLLAFLIGDKSVRGLCRYYDQVAEGEPLMLVGSGGYLELAVNQGSAKEMFKASAGDRVFIHKDAAGPSDEE